MKPLIIVPTIASHKYIVSSIRVYQDELQIVRECYPDADMLVVVNGTEHENERVLRCLIQAGVQRCMLIEVAGKNNAINQGVQYAKQHGFDVVHLLDDDVRFECYSLLRNILELEKVSARLHDKRVLVGSNFKPCPNDKLTFLQTIFRLPYMSFNPSKTVSGQSLCFYTHETPTLPVNAVADDAFICLWAVSSVHGIDAISKPFYSVVYFQPAKSLLSWYKQKLRTTVGVVLLKSEREKHFSHKFSYLFRYRKGFKGIPLRYYPHSAALKFLLIILEIHARWNIKRKKSVLWSTVDDSKYF